MWVFGVGLRLVLWGLGLYVGFPEEQDKQGSLIHEVKDQGVKANESANVRYFQTRDAIPFHTDGCDAFALMCLSQGRSGGLSQLASATTAFNILLKERPDLANVLQNDFYFDARKQHPCGQLCQVQPVFTFWKNQLSIVFKIP